MLDPKWRARAACKGMATRYYDPWDPPPEMYEAPPDAAAICGLCPVRIECLVDALATNDDACVRAGLTAKQRRTLKRPRYRLGCPVCAGRLTAPLTTALQVCTSCGLTWRTPKLRPPQKRVPEMRLVTA